MKTALTSYFAQPSNLAKRPFWSSLQHAETTVGHNGHIRYSLADTLKQMKKTKS